MISDTFHSGLLGVAYLLCLLLSGVQSPYPATSVVTVSANTGTGDPTFTNNINVNCISPLKSNLFPPFTLLYTCTCYDLSSNNMLVYTHDLTRRWRGSTGFDKIITAVLKDSL